jgi:hypothetical protein
MIISETLDMYITVLDVNFTTLINTQYVPSPIDLTNISTNILSFISSVQVKLIWTQCNDSYCYNEFDCSAVYCVNY